MKKVLGALAALALVVWVVSWFRMPEAVATSGGRPWPGGLGSLESVQARLKPMQANAASVQLTALVNAIPNHEPIAEFVAREIARGELRIGVPPALPDVKAMRDLLLREPIVWSRRDGIDHPDISAMRGVQMHAARLLVATALAKARSNDPTAWDELHAAWRLSHALDGHPQVMAQTAALSTVRMINGVAWKLPLPAPDWFLELQQRDPIAPLLAAYQFQTASYWSDGEQLFPTKWHADSVDHDRQIAETVFRTTACDVTVPMNKLGVDLASVWRRAFRYRAEREATRNAMRIREGNAIETKSVCSDGSWAFDGKTLRFSRAIETAAPDRPMPLALEVKE
jgi:hypothetical protein